MVKELNKTPFRLQINIEDQMAPKRYYYPIYERVLKIAKFTRVTFTSLKDGILEDTNSDGGGSSTVNGDWTGIFVCVY